MSEEAIGNSWLSDLQDQHTDESAKQEATRQESIKGGRYRMTVKKAKEDILNGDKCPTPGRPVLKIQAVAQLPDEKTHLLFFEISPKPYKKVVDNEGNRLTVPQGHELYTPASKHDSPYKNWVGFECLIGGGPKGKPTIGDVVNGLDGLEFSAYVSEGFSNPDGELVFPKTDEERKAFIAEGWSAKNYVSQIRK